MLISCKKLIYTYLHISIRIFYSIFAAEIEDLTLVNSKSRGDLKTASKAKQQGPLLINRCKTKMKSN